jgi:microcystin-dependent protein
MSNNCSNCYNGCVETTSDQCVRYTGLSVPTLGIETGDSLLQVEQALITFLLSTLDGTGIKLTIDQSIICEIVSKYLVACDDLTLPNIIQALIKAICELEERVVALEEDFAALEGSYTVSCLTGVTSTSGTHAILQAAINKLCALEVELDALALTVETSYVKLADLDALIAAYLSGLGSTKYYTRMVPFTVVEYYGDLTGKFDVSGAGLGDWEKIYLCNGNTFNGFTTPDKRGRVPIGATSGMGGGPLDAAVDPANPLNPSYSLMTKAGANYISLSTSQIPSHTHTATDSGHQHKITGTTSGSTAPNGAAVYPTFNSTTDLGGNVFTTPIAGLSDVTTGFATITVTSTGGGQSHPNNQPAIGCYYIMYIP